MFEELIFQCLIAGVVSSSIEQSGVLGVVFSDSLHLLVVVGASQGGQSIGEHLAAARVQLLTVVLGQLSAERVDGDDDGSTVSFEGENLAHDVGSGAAKILAEVVESLKVRLVQSVSDDLDVHLIQILFADAIDEERGQWCIDQHGVVQFRWSCSDVNGLHLLETSQGVAFGDQLGDGSLVERPGDQQDDVVNHVAVSDEVEEGRERLDGVISHVLELNHKLFAQLIVDDRHSQRRWLIGEELSVIRALQMKLQI